MTQKAITEKMKRHASQLKAGRMTVYECEKAMTEAILDGVLELPCNTAEENDRRIAAVRKLKRRMWRLLLEATK